MRERITTMFAATVLLLATALHVQAQDPIKELATLGNKIGGCSQIRNKLKIFQAKYKDYKFSFAARNDSTLTGIKGCGYGIDKKKSKADALAMKFCKEWEKTYGTDGGKKVCRLVEL